MKLLTKEEMKSAMETYKFECRKSKERWSGHHYTKKYSFVIPPTIYEIFEEQVMRLTTNKDACELDLRLRFATLRDKKGIIWPVLNIFYDIQPKPGDKLVKDEDEAIMFLDLCLEHLASKATEFKTDRIKAQKKNIRDIIKAGIQREGYEQKQKNKALDAIHKEVKALQAQYLNIEIEIDVEARKDIYKELIKKKTLEYQRFADRLCGEKFSKEVIAEVIKEFKPLTKKEKEELEFDKQHADTK